MTVLVTGATGFVGRRIVSALVIAGERVRVAVRGRDSAFASPVEVAVVGEIGPDTLWDKALEDVEVVIHAAGHVHHREEPPATAAAKHDTVNHLGARRLAEAAASVGVRRVVFISTVKVLGEATTTRPFTDAMPADPRDAYGRSKWQGEEALFDIAGREGIEAVVLRPPLVYGPGVKANFRSLLSLCAKPWPLPLGRIANRRSFIFVDNLADATLSAARAPAAAGHRFLVSDGLPLSTSALIGAIRRSMDRPARLFHVPEPLLRLVGCLVGRSSQIERLVGGAEIDDSGIRQMLGWTPRFAFDEAIKTTVCWHMAGCEDG